ncbi:MAG TPA: TPM domain-containing protein [Polyangiaceae bacterium]|nr:TPM domain-containing protein [Polyangiaceae bacterium]
MPQPSLRVSSLLRPPALVAFVAFVALLLFGRPAAAAFVPPPITGHVTDTAGKLTRDERLALDKKLEDYRVCSLHEVAVLVTGSLDGETIEDVAYKTFRAWKVGRKKEDDGVLLVLAPTERKLRIETGKGVGGALTDVQSARILADHVKPHLKVDATFAAIDEGTTAIGAALGGCAMSAADAGAIAATRVAPASPTPRVGGPSDPAAPYSPPPPSAAKEDSGASDRLFLFVGLDVALAALGLVALVVYAAFRDRRLIIPFPFAFVGAGFLTLGVGMATESTVACLIASHLAFLGIYLGLWRWVRTVHKAPLRPQASGWGGASGSAYGGGSSYESASSSADSGGGYSSGGSSGGGESGGGYSGSGYSGGGGESGGGGASDSY